MEFDFTIGWHKEVQIQLSIVVCIFQTATTKDTENSNWLIRWY